MIDTPAGGEPVLTPAQYDAAVRACPEPYNHEVFRYCPACPWVEGRPIGADQVPAPERAEPSVAELGAQQLAALRLRHLAESLASTASIVIAAVDAVRAAAVELEDYQQTRDGA